MLAVLLHAGLEGINLRFLVFVVLEVMDLLVDGAEADLELRLHGLRLEEL